MDTKFTLEAVLGCSDKALLGSFVFQGTAWQLHAKSIQDAWTVVHSFTTSVSRNGTMESSPPPRVTQSIDYLQKHRFSLQFSDVNVRDLLTILNITRVSQESCLLLLAVWAKKTPTGPRIPPKVKKLTSELLEDAIMSVSLALPKLSGYGALVLFLGVVALATLSPPAAVKTSMNAISSILSTESVEEMVGLEELLAGVGYAMAATPPEVLPHVFSNLISFLGRRNGPISIQEGSLFMKLMEQEGMRLRRRVMGSEEDRNNYVLRLIAYVKICERHLQKKLLEFPSPMQCLALSALSGLLTGACGKEGKFLQAAGSQEAFKWNSIVEQMKEDVILSAMTVESFCFQENNERIIFLKASVFTESGLVSGMDRLRWIRFVALCVLKIQSSKKPTILEPNPQVLWALAVGLWGDALQVERSSHVLPGGDGEAWGTSPLLEDSPTLLKHFCETFQDVDITTQVDSVQFVATFCTETYNSHRSLQFKAGRGESQGDVSVHRKVLEASFLSACMFFMEVLRGINLTRENYEGKDVKFAMAALSSLACLNFTRVQLPEYRKMVEYAVFIVSRSSAVSLALELESALPSFQDMIQLSDPEMKGYSWSADSIQSAKVHFWLRVLPALLQNFPAESVENKIAPILFLYLHSIEEEVSLSSHALFAAYMKSVFESWESKAGGASHDDILPLKLALHYVQLSMEGFPGVTPIKGVVSGIGAIVQYSPAGSPVVAMCLSTIGRRSLELLISQTAPPSKPLKDNRTDSKPLDKPESTAESGKSVCSDEMKELDHGNMSKVMEGQLLGESGGKLRSLLVHLIPVVDFQLLPVVLQVVATLFLEVSSRKLDPQTEPLEELRDVLTESDDYTRKPYTVPFFQKISYLCALNASKLRIENLCSKL